MEQLLQLSSGIVDCSPPPAAPPLPPPMPPPLPPPLPPPSWGVALGVASTASRSICISLALSSWPSATLASSLSTLLPPSSLSRAPSGRAELAAAGDLEGEPTSSSPPLPPPPPPLNAATRSLQSAVSGSAVICAPPTLRMHLAPRSPQAGR